MNPAELRNDGDKVYRGIIKTMMMKYKQDKRLTKAKGEKSSQTYDDAV